MTTPFSRTFFGALVLALMVFTGAGCDSGGNDDGGDNGLGSGSLNASVGGSSFSATVVTGTYVNGVLALGGNLGASSSTQRQINLTVPGASVGSHSIGIGGGIAIYSEGSTVSNLEAYAGTSGTITIDELSDEHAKGSFSFTGRANSGTQKSVTNGTFDVNF